MTDRHQFRANWHDYNDGVYFVTICCAEKQHYFGEIHDGEMKLTAIGLITKSCINNISLHLPYSEVLNYVIMPNHIHLVISVNNVGTRHGASASNGIGCLTPKRHEPSHSQDFHHNSNLAVIIGQFKSTIKRESNKNNIPFSWQPRFHEHIIRHQQAFDNIMNYIDNNVINWCYDRFNVNRIDDADAPWRVPTNFHDYEA